MIWSYDCEIFKFYIHKICRKPQENVKQHRKYKTAVEKKEKLPNLMLTLAPIWQYVPYFHTYNDGFWHFSTHNLSTENYNKNRSKQLEVLIFFVVVTGVVRIICSQADCPLQKFDLGKITREITKWKFMRKTRPWWRLPKQTATEMRLPKPPWDHSLRHKTWGLMQQNRPKHH